MIVFRKLIVSMLILVMMSIPMSIMVVANETPVEQLVRDEMLHLLDTRYYHDIDTSELVDMSVEGILNRLDGYSGYIETPLVADLTTVAKPYIGCGMQIVLRDDNVFVMKVLEGAPAHISGIMIGDRIMAIDATEVDGMSIETIATLLKGEEGTTVEIDLLRDGEPLRVPVYRGVVEKPKSADVEWLQIECNENESEVLETEEIAFVTISKFSAGVSTEFKTIVDASIQKKIHQMIIDLRGNKGGLLSEVLEICRLIIPEGTIVQLKDKSEQLVTYTSTLEQVPFDVVVLTDNQTASASEILASAVVESAVGITVGETTYGKGVVQSVYKLSDGNYFKMTTAEYITRLGNQLNCVGISPSIEILGTPSPEKYLKLDNITNKFGLNDKNDQIMVIESMLYELGYFDGKPDNLFDTATAYAVEAFQLSEGLYPYGACDLTTQKNLNEAIEALQLEEDIVRQVAIAYVTSN